MNMLLKNRILWIAGLSLAAISSATAGTFRWEYRFNSGDIAYGEINAEKGKTHLENLRSGTYFNLRLTNGREYSEYVQVYHRRIVPLHGTTGLDLWMEEDWAPWYTFFAADQYSAVIQMRSYDSADFASNEVLYDHGPYARPFVLISRSGPSEQGFRLFDVPDSGATGLLLGLSLLGLMAFERRKQT